MQSLGPGIRLYYGNYIVIRTFRPFSVVKVLKSKYNSKYKLRLLCLSTYVICIYIYIIEMKPAAIIAAGKFRILQIINIVVAFLRHPDAITCTRMSAYVWMCVWEGSPKYPLTPYEWHLQKSTSTIQQITIYEYTSTRAHCTVINLFSLFMFSK